MEKSMTELTQDYADGAVPENQTRSLVSITAVIIAFTINIGAILLGTRLGFETDFKTVLTGSFTGALILASIAGAMAVIGVQTRLSTAMISKFTFGHKGAYIVAVILAITLIGWFGVQTELFALSIQNVFVNTFDITLPRLTVVVLGGILMSTTAIIGFKALEKLSILTAPLLLALVIWPVISLMIAGDFPDLFAYAPENPLRHGSVVALVAGSFMAGAIVTPDITRYASSKKSAIIASIIGFVGFYIVLLVLSAIMAIASGATDFISIFMAMGLGIPALVIIILATWTTNDSNLYTASLSLKVLFPQISKWQLASIAGLCGTIAAAAGILNMFIPFLIALGLLITPVGGVMVMDYFLKRGFYQAKNISKLSQFKFAEMIAWLFGCFVGFLTTESVHHGLEVLVITTIPPLDGFLAAAFFTFAMNRIFVAKPL